MCAKVKRPIYIILAVWLLLMPHLASAQIAPTYVAGQVGVNLEVFPNSLQYPPASPVSLAGASAVNLVCLPPNHAARESLPMAVSGDGTYAFRSTLAADFPVPGAYSCQLSAAWGSTTLSMSAPFTFTVLTEN